jgi:hypothetical protein
LDLRPLPIAQIRAVGNVTSATRGWQYAQDM